MSIQMIAAREGKEFVTTYAGRHLKEKLIKNPKYRKRVPKRWVTEGYVEEKEVER